ncbi:Tetratricopeptide repeat-containing protein [Granulicella rosea]|uniref:Tetratricopeptide repeat-containing protein n=1 Tax=Granulicella rosea TaxID=474952 RepID=A0A239L7A1_9BACT|nr:tetratricopeptide repeat protein [Granulicella rosea]SNT25788.1 Tetratricopeptide repeat-containing protein [Granulicella rosea]
MDQQIKAALKQDNLLATTETGLDWVSQNRKTVIAGSAALLVLIVAAIVSFVVYNKRSEAASEAFGAAMQAYQTPIAQPGQPIPVGVKTYSSPEERAKNANAMFMDTANKYSMMPDGKVSLYFAGLTYMEAGENKSAEDTLKKVADGMDKSLGALAKLALAQLYRTTGRDAQAIDLYNQLTDKPTSTVPAGLAQLQLAELYNAEGKTDLAKKIYAHLKDTDAKGAAGTVAAAKLNPAPAGGAQGLQ